MSRSDPFVELLDQSRAVDRAEGRRRERVLRHVAEEEASLAGTLVDLAEEGAVVTVRTDAGRTHRGVVAGVGGDFCVVRADTGGLAYVRLGAVATVRPHPGQRHAAAAGARPPTSDLLLLEALARLAPERPRLTLVTRGGEAVTGELLAVGNDIVTLGLDGDPRARCYVSASSVVEAGLLRSG